MSNFEELVFRMRESQKRFKKNPTRSNKLTMENNESDVDSYLEFLQSGCLTFKEVKEWVEQNEQN